MKILILHRDNYRKFLKVFYSEIPLIFAQKLKDGVKITLRYRYLFFILNLIFLNSHTFFIL